MSKLDDVSAIKALDSQDQFGMVASLSPQLMEAYEAAVAVELEDFGEVSGIAVAGMGGSAIGSDVVAAAYSDQLGSPMATVRGYELPRWISSRSLVFAVSYSGNTEETLSCVEEALDRSCRVICVSTGGKLGDIAAREGLPYIEVPTSLQPRAAMGWLSIPIAACLESLGLLESVEEDVREAGVVIDQLAELYGPANPGERNPAKQLANALENRIPIIYGSELTAVAAYRWKCQINENSKALAFAHEFPELNHNEVVGWERPAERMKDFQLIYLRDAKNHPQNNKRMDITADLLAGYIGDIKEYSATGQSRLARLLSSSYLGDFVSLYLAILYGIDPSPVERIEDLKRRLA